MTPDPYFQLFFFFLIKKWHNIRFIILTIFEPYSTVALRLCAQLANSSPELFHLAKRKLGTHRESPVPGTCRGAFCLCGLDYSSYPLTAQSCSVRLSVFWLTSLSRMSSTFSMLCPNFLPCERLNHTPLCVQTTLGGLHFLAVVSNAAMHIDVLRTSDLLKDISVWVS